MTNENVFQAIVAFIIGLVITFLANKLASIPFRVRRLHLDTKNTGFRAIRAFWFCCGTLWMIGGIFLLLDPSLAMQVHMPWVRRVW